jgi:glycosyltransferase involved in cell wall biosynthesis
MPLVSIIVPVYNNEKYLQQCIDSLINQTLRDIEIILVNDGSNDNSLLICHEFQKIDTRIKVIDKPNGGVSSARNAGLKIASGEYVGFVDSDDWIEPDMYEKMYSAAEKHEADAVVVSFKINMDRKEHLKKVRLLEGSHSASTLLDLHIEDGSLKGMLMPSNCNTIYRSEIINRNNLFFDEELKINEDGIFNLKFLMKARTVYSLPNDYVYHYRIYYHRTYKDIWNEFEKADNKLFEISKGYHAHNFERQLKLRSVYNAIIATINESKSDKPKKTIVTNLRKIYSSQSVVEGIRYIKWGKLGISRKVLVVFIKYRLALFMYMIIKSLKM